MQETVNDLFQNTEKRIERPIHDHNAVENDIKSKKEIERITKKCPNISCNQPMNRTCMCAHMTCPNCGTDYCWACKVIWKPRKNVLHLVGCQVGTIHTIAKEDLDTSGYATGWDRDEEYDTSLDAPLWLQESDK
jgi:hypothetical protein